MFTRLPQRCSSAGKAAAASQAAFRSGAKPFLRRRPKDEGWMDLILSVHAVSLKEFHSLIADIRVRAVGRAIGPTYTVCGLAPRLRLLSSSRPRGRTPPLLLRRRATEK